jgi:hypothetical protein
MAMLLRVVGAVWILLTAREVLQLIRRLLLQGIHLQVGTHDLLYVLMLAGGVGLLLLREWGRWVLLVGACAFLLLQVGPSLLQFKISPLLIRHLIFYGIFIGLLLIPQAKAATRK